MAAADVINQAAFAHHAGVAPSTTTDRPSKKHNVRTVLNYYNDPGNGSEPAAFYVAYVCSSTYLLTYLSGQHAPSFLMREC